MTQPGIEQVDAAVLSVLQRRAVGDRSVGPGVEVFAGRLFSLRSAEGLRPGTRDVQVAPRTVVTPLARDHLRRLGIQVRVVSWSQVEGGRGRGEWGFAIDSDSAIGPALRRGWLEDVSGWSEISPEWEELSGWIGSGEGRGALLLSDEASVAVWRACRSRGVRAAAPAEPEGVARAVRGLGMNLLVVEPSGKSISLIRQLGQEFRALGGASTPRGTRPGGGEMRIAEVIGRLTLSRSHPSLRGGRFIITLPMPLEALTADSPRRGEEVIAFDALGPASPGGLIGLSEGREAANPFGKVKTPVDAYCACLLDQLSL